MLSIYQKILATVKSPRAYTENLVKNKFSNLPKELNSKELRIIKDISIAIELGRKYIPWKNLCRHQAWQAVFLLQKAKIPFTYHVGIKKADVNRSEGHAWVMVNQKFVSGKCKLSDYAEINFSRV